MKLLKTLRVRFALWTAALLLITLSLFGLFVYISFARGLYQSRDDALLLAADQVVATLARQQDGLPVSTVIGEAFTTTSPNEDVQERALTIRLYAPDGKLLYTTGLYRSLPVLTDSLARANLGKKTFVTVTDPQKNDPIRFYTQPIFDQGHVHYILQVAQNFDEINELLRQLLKRLLIGAPVLIMTATLGSYWLVARALAPINYITRRARRISAADLTARLNLPPIDDEVGRLAGTFDDMLARLDNSFRRERQFVANASHELRTPLAIMQAILGVIRTERRTVEDYEQALADIAGEADRLQSLTENLLLLARGDAQRTVQQEPLDLALLLTDVTDSLRPLAETKTISLTCQTPAQLMVQGDPDSLIRLFVNLLDNAIKYTQQGVIAVVAKIVAATIQITVTDTGCGIPPQHLPYIFERFYRVDSARTSQGAGLGLAIALDIVHAHGGAIQATSREGEGTTFTVQLPLYVA